MLAALSIRDIVLIERLTIDFGAGLTVLTGETGAGKSILLDALSLALGARGDGSLVRHGAEQGQVTAVLDLPAAHPSAAILRDNGIEPEDRLILRRVQNADGRSRAFVNDQPVGVALLRTLAPTLVEIHGQHDDRALVDAAAHRALLDAAGGLGASVGAVGAAFRAWRAAEETAAALRRRIEAGRAEADYLRAAAEELGALCPQPGEEEALAGRRQAMMQAERVAGDLAEALAAVAGPDSPVPGLAALLRRLERKRDGGGGLIEPALEPLARAVDALRDTEAALDAAGRRAEFDPKALEQVEERLFALRAAARKYSITVDRLPELAARFAAELVELDTGEESLAGAVAAAATARAAYERAATGLGEARRKAAAKLEARVRRKLPALKLDRAAFLVRLEPLADPAEHGTDRVEFFVQTNPGAPAGPMMRIASGGELSRFLLALKVALADRGSAPTLVFDEIDTGAGGAVSDAIGQRLARLSASVQVIAVTHAPQVAARASGHLLIDKARHEAEDRVVTRVMPLDAARRREEIARMLAGSVVTDEARAAADRLIVGA